MIHVIRATKGRWQNTGEAGRYSREQMLRLAQPIRTSDIDDAPSALSDLDTVIALQGSFNERTNEIHISAILAEGAESIAKTASRVGVTARSIREWVQRVATKRLLAVLGALVLIGAVWGVSVLPMPAVNWLAAGLSIAPPVVIVVSAALHAVVFGGASWMLAPRKWKGDDPEVSIVAENGGRGALGLIDIDATAKAASAVLPVVAMRLGRTRAATTSAVIASIIGSLATVAGLFAMAFYGWGLNAPLDDTVANAFQISTGIFAVVTLAGLVLLGILFVDGLLPFRSRAAKQAAAYVAALTLVPAKNPSVPEDTSPGNSKTRTRRGRLPFGIGTFETIVEEM